MDEILSENLVGNVNLVCIVKETRWKKTKKK